MYSPGAAVAKIGDRTMGAGVGRIMNASLASLSADQPHFDSLPLHSALKAEAGTEGSSSASIQGAASSASSPKGKGAAVFGEGLSAAVAASALGDIHSQFSANIYLQMPPNLSASPVGERGELELWNVPALSVDAILEADGDRDWRAELPESILVRPSNGDLVLFNTRKPHAIR